jgi:RepB DNA-primase from phage plasmid/WD domain, G-beta repeat
LPRPRNVLSFSWRQWYFSPDGRFALSGSDKTLRLWDIATRQCLRIFEGHTDSVKSAAFSPDGRFALSGSSDKTLRLWDVTTGQCLRTFEDGATPVAFSPDGRFVISVPMASKHQVVWKVSGFSQEEAESLLHNLANKFGGDLAATDSTRVLRLPGFANRKLPEEFIVEARKESDAIYTLHDFKIDENSPETARDLGHAQERRRTVLAEHKSQSERDWAYAKRALARGDDLEVVIQRIADYREDDKTDPNYYARYTVTKAQAALDTKRTQKPKESKSQSEPTRAVLEH